MDSIYLRSISDDLKSYQGKRCCDFCKKENSKYTCGYLSFCCCSDANNYHLNYDVAASSHAIFSIMWLKGIILDIDVIYLISCFLYKSRKRQEPHFVCDNCKHRSKCVHFIYNPSLKIDGDLCFCSKRCRQSFFGSKCRNIVVYHKPFEERIRKYRW